MTCLCPDPVMGKETQQKYQRVFFYWFHSRSIEDIARLENLTPKGVLNIIDRIRTGNWINEPCRNKPCLRLNGKPVAEGGSDEA